jgi:hypothetical protein
MKYPKTAAAIEKAQGDQWAIAYALVEEVGKPSGDAYHDGSGERFKECAAELAEQGYVGSHGQAWSPATLRTYRDVAARFASARILADAPWSVYLTAYQLGVSDDLLALLQSCVDGARPKALLPPNIPQNSYHGTYRDLPWIIRDRGRVAVNDVMLATGERRMHERGSEKPKAKASDPVRSRADEVEDALADPDVREQVKADLADMKGGRKMAATVKAWEAEAEAARVEAEREEQRVAKVAREQLGKARDYWPELQRQIDAFTKLIGTYFRDFDDLPFPEPYELRLLDGALENLSGGIDRFEKKLHPGGKNRLRRGNVIDIA